MLFKYKVLTKEGSEQGGTIDAINTDIAIASLQRRGFVIVSIDEADQVPFFQREFRFFGTGISNKEIVILSRQIATLFDAQVSALRVFRLLSGESENTVMTKILTAVSDDIQGGMSLSKALSQHPDAFSTFYVNMVRSGEESGKLSETFLYLADYLDRSYELTTKTKNALVYPAFVIVTFIVVMILMLTLVVPRLSDIITESGQEIPVYTQIILGISSFLVEYGIFFLVVLVIGVMIFWRFLKTERGEMSLAQARLDVPYIGDLYEKLYLSRISDNMNTMLSSGISMVRALEITSSVVGNRIYKQILEEASENVRAGSSLSDALSSYPEIPTILIQMIRIGEETGELGNILKTLAVFYKREVDNAVDTLVGLIEPVMIVFLGIGVAILLTSVLMPIYNVTSSI